MRKRNNAPANSSDESDEESILAAHPQEIAFQDNKLADENETSNLGCSNFHTILKHLKQGKVWWVKCLTIYIAASLTYSYHNAGISINVQIAIMTMITLVGATPFSSTHLITGAIGAFVGGQNVIGSTGLLEDNNTIHASNYLWLLLLSTVVGLIWCFAMNSNLKVLDGYAGRLGTCTFIGMQITMLTTFGPAGVVEWNRIWYGFVHTVHIGEEESSLSLATAWKGTEESELAFGYVFSVLLLGVAAGGMRILHNNYVERCKAGPSPTKEPPASLNNVLVPVLLALLSMLVVNATQYKHAPGLYNGFAVGAYVAMASLEKISSISKFASVSLLAAGWGLALTPFFVGFAGKSGFTAMLGHVTHVALGGLFQRLKMIRRQKQEKRRRQLDLLQLEIQEQRQAVQSTPTKNDEGQQESHPSPHHHHHKPKRETFYTKQQRRQQQKLKHLQEEARFSKEQDLSQNPPKLHHRAWSALPADGDGVWQHSLESQQELNSVV